LRSNRSDRRRGVADGGPYYGLLENARGRLGRLASAVFHYPTIGSTNDAAAALAETHDAEGIVVVADEQTAGRGRRGHTWFSPAGTGLYVSVVLTPSRAVRDVPRAIRLLTPAAGVALVEAIDAVAGLAVDLKWPNDVCVAGRKLAGILAEGVSSGMAVDFVILGYGINLRTGAYPPDLAGRATSLEAELGCQVDRGRLFVETLAAIAKRYDDLLAGHFDGILDAWRRHAPGASGARVRWNEGSGHHVGVTAGIDQDGALLIRVGERMERIVAGEVQWEIDSGSRL
jgi:BirA family biotin operon repressor/biotin-[acetyl-CoA-carboxylase] ligase